MAIFPSSGQGGVGEEGGPERKSSGHWQPSPCTPPAGARPYEGGLGEAELGPAGALASSSLGTSE